MEAHPATLGNAHRLLQATPRFFVRLDLAEQGRTRQEAAGQEVHGTSVARAADRLV